MDKYESFAIGHYLSSWPEEWNFKQIISELKDGDNDLVTTSSSNYEWMHPEDLAEAIENMIDGLRRVF